MSKALKDAYRKADRAGKQLGRALEAWMRLWIAEEMRKARGRQ